MSWRRTVLTSVGPDHTSAPYQLFLGLAPEDKLPVGKMLKVNR
jgi:hypothetical protein